jgi:hypothetical protein
MIILLSNNIKDTLIKQIFSFNLTKIYLINFPNHQYNLKENNQFLLNSYSFHTTNHLIKVNKIKKVPSIFKTFIKSFSLKLISPFSSAL